MSESVEPDVNRSTRAARDGKAASDARQFPDMWATPATPARPSRPPAGRRRRVSSRSTSDQHRMTLELKATGSTPSVGAALRAAVDARRPVGLARAHGSPRSSTTGFRRGSRARGPKPRRYRTEEDRDLDFNGAVADDDVVADAWESWNREVAHAREVYAGIVDLGAEVRFGDERAEVRDIVVHLIEEYARHVGHADLLRERIDGRTGQ